MKKLKQIFVALVVSVFIVPQIVFAAWWNPLNWDIWNIFRPTPRVQEVQISTTTATVSKRINPSTTIVNSVDTAKSKQKKESQKDCSIIKVIREKDECYLFHDIRRKWWKYKKCMLWGFLFFYFL
jgi:hypothetical protein